jgi:hydrogenase maturation protein HypF
MQTGVESPRAADATTDHVLEIEGIVQGVGFRPFVARLAETHGVRGWVRNNRRGVEVRIAGSAAAVDRFTAALRAEAPPAARVVRVQARISDERCENFPLKGFSILQSDETGANPSVGLSPDLALCDECRAELGSAGDRRRGYPFINCTNCGPRYSIVRQLPYDRARTTMAEFVMCPLCRREFEDPADRRFHAEPNACPACGPRVTLLDGAGVELATDERAIEHAARALHIGKIVAVKGVGGFHLMVDATDEATVAELRRRKRREEKPLAVMFPSLEALGDAAELSDDDIGLLKSVAAPIVLVRRRSKARIATGVAPGNPWLGAILPYAPLHVLLLKAVGRPVVATSGNLSEEPLCIDNNEARARLGAVADLFLVHDRGIARPVDDSVVRPARAGPVILRRARGYAPAPLPLPKDTFAAEPILCVGGHLKNTIAVAAGHDLVLSPHLGDLANPVSIAAFRRAVELLGSLHAARFSAVVCDAHPDYASTRFAGSLGLPVTGVQHHLAHVLACLLEHDGGPERVLGVAWDGTGFGADGTIWGGEFFIVDRVARTARRVARLRPFRLPGGEAAVREPRRSALAVVHALSPAELDAWLALAAEMGFREYDAVLLRTMIERGVQAPVATSAGRLFDAVAALLGLRRRSTFEGQAAMDVEAAADGVTGPATPWPMPLAPGDFGCCAELDWRPAVAALLRERRDGDVAQLTARFHATLAAGIVTVAKRCGVRSVVLTGGCFQNVRLLELSCAGLQDEGFAVLRHRQLPPNDGGIAAGQALGALWGITAVADAPA